MRNECNEFAMPGTVMLRKDLMTWHRVVALSHWAADVFVSSHPCMKLRSAKWNVKTKSVARMIHKI